MKENKPDISKVIFLAITIIAAILIFSLTIGKDWYEGRDQTVQSFAIIHFAGYLFFLLMPVEMAFAYCIANHSQFITIISIALGTAIIAQILDYIIGYFISSRIILKYMGDRKTERAKKYIRKYGDLTIFIFNLFPLSSPVICLTAGMIKYPIKKVLFYSFTGLLIKYLVVGLLFY